MADVLDSDGFSAFAFFAVAIAAVAAWRNESGRFAQLDVATRPSLWPRFWLLLAAAYAGVALVLGSDLISTLGGLGRDYARVEEWYESRRPLQVAAIAVVTTGWLAIVVIGIWRVPARRRRYLPSAIMFTSLVCFGLIRIISLHQVDTVTQRTRIADVPVGTVVELAGLVVALLLIADGARRPIDGNAEGTDDAADPRSQSDTDAIAGARRPEH